MIKMAQNKINVFLFFFVFSFIHTQTPRIPKYFSFNKYLDVFIEANIDDANFKPNKSIIHLLAFDLKKSKEDFYSIWITKDNIDTRMIDQNAKYLFFFKYKCFDILLQGNTMTDVNFLKRIVKNKIVSKKNKITFNKSFENMTYEPYQWYLFFDRTMKLKKISITDDENKVKKLFDNINLNYPSQ